MWNSHGRLKLVHIDVLPADIDTCYRPDVELVGNISATLNMMTETFTEAVYVPPEVELILTDLGRQRTELAERAARRGGMPIHPLRIVKELQDIVSDDVTLCVDMGSFHIWIARYLYSFRARQLLISNGQQTMGSRCRGPSARRWCAPAIKWCLSPATADSCSRAWNWRPRCG